MIDDKAVRAKVARFFAPYDTQQAFLDNATRLVALSREDPKIARSLLELKQALAGPIIDPQSEEVAARLRQTRSRGMQSQSMLPESAQTLMALLYNRASVELRTNNGAAQDIRGRIEGLSKGSKKFDARLIGELVVEAELRATRDPRFARMLEDSARDFEEAAHKLNSLILREHVRDLLILEGPTAQPPSEEPRRTATPERESMAGVQEAGPCCSFTFNDRKVFDHVCHPSTAYDLCMGLIIGVIVVFIFFGVLILVAA